MKTKFSITTPKEGVSDEWIESTVRSLSVTLMQPPTATLSFSCDDRRPLIEKIIDEGHYRLAQKLKTAKQNPELYTAVESKIREMLISQLN